MPTNTNLLKGNKQCIIQTRPEVEFSKTASEPALIPHADLRNPGARILSLLRVFLIRGFKRRYDLYRQFEKYVARTAVRSL